MDNLKIGNRNYIFREETEDGKFILEAPYRVFLNGRDESAGSAYGRSTLTIRRLANSSRPFTMDNVKSDIPTVRYSIDFKDVLHKIVTTDGSDDYPILVDRGNPRPVHIYTVIETDADVGLIINPSNGLKNGCLEADILATLRIFLSSKQNLENLAIGYTNPALFDYPTSGNLPLDYPV